MNSHPASLRSFKFHEFYILFRRAHVFLKCRTGLYATHVLDIR